MQHGTASHYDYEVQQGHALSLADAATFLDHRSVVTIGSKGQPR